MQTIIYDLDQIFNWYSKTEERDGEQLLSHLTVFDNGLEDFKRYQDGVLREVSRFDNPEADGNGVKPWSEISTYFSEDGELEAKVHTYDNGVTTFRGYENGVMTEFTSQDSASPDGGVHVWDTISGYYDESGELTARVIVYDNGIERVDQFTDGILTLRIQTDVTDVEGGDGASLSGIKKWSTIETYFDEDGRLEARLTKFDDGRERDVFYENDVRQRTVVRDNPDSETNGVKAWDTIETFYNEDGGFDARVMVFDNGRVTETFYSEDGHKTQVFQTDGMGEGAYAWKTQTQFYDEAGNLAVKTIEYDDGDVTELLFTDGSLSVRKELDGDDSASWFGRVTHYDDEGDIVTREIYLSAEDLPEDFGLGQSVIGDF